MVEEHNLLAGHPNSDDWLGMLLFLLLAILLYYVGREMLLMAEKSQIRRKQNGKPFCL